MLKFFSKISLAIILLLAFASTLLAQQNEALDELCDSVFSALQRKSFNEVKEYIPGYRTIKITVDSAKVSKLPSDILISQKTIEWELSRDFKRLEKDASANGLSLQRMELLKTRYTIDAYENYTYARVRQLVYSNRKRHEIHWVAALLNEEWYLIEALKYEKGPEDEYAVDFDKIEAEIEKKKEKQAKEKQKVADKETREAEREYQKQEREQSADSLRKAREQSKENNISTRQTQQDSLQRARQQQQDSTQKARAVQKRELEQLRAWRKDSIERVKQHRQDLIMRRKEELEKKKSSQ